MFFVRGLPLKKRFNIKTKEKKLGIIHFVISFIFDDIEIEIDHICLCFGDYS